MPDLRRVYSLVLFAVFIACALVVPQEAWAKKSNPSNTQNAKYASIVLDAQTGQVFSEKYADKLVHPASLTKMMTMYMAFREIEAGRLSLDDYIVVSKHAASQPASKVGLPAGKRIKVRDAIGLIVTLSANDLATALGEKISGSETGFARDMTNVAHAMGMKSTQFKNANGLPNKAQVTTARDMAILARGLLYHYPSQYHFFGLKNYNYNGKSYHSHNRLMNTFPGMDGMKTGFINDSGFNLVASAKRDGTRLIGVVFGGRSWQTRNNHMADLLNTGFAEAKGRKYPGTQQSGQIQVASAAKAPKAPAETTETRSALYEEVSTKPARVNEALRSPASPSPIAKPASLAQPAVYQPAIKTATPASLNATAPAAASGGHSGGWAIQVGAYSNQTLTQGVAQRTAANLVGRFGSARAVVVPFQSQNGLLYRARVGGLSQSQAVEACRILSSCLVVQPNS